MANNALYFPYINVPADPWLLRMMLYWDRLSSIVPYDHARNPDRLSPKMRDLVSAGLVDQIIPAQHIHKLPNFHGPFIKYAEKWLERRRGQIGKEFSKIHIEKLEQVRRPLERMGLIRDADYPWVEMPTSLANSFMAYLAASLGQLKDIDAAPVTGSTPLGISLATTKRSLIREALLEDLFPVPASSEHLTIESVIAFKEKYQAQATRFRQRIEEECIIISSTSDPDFRSEMLSALGEKLKRESKEVSEAMQLTWKSVAFGSILPILSAALPILDADWKLQAAAAAGAVGSLGSAVFQVSQGIGQARNTENRPMAYVPLVKKHLFKLR